VQLSSLCGIEKYIYNNTNYVLLGIIMRRTTGKSAGKGLGIHIEEQERGDVVAADRGSQVRVNHLSLTANALAISQLAGILAVQAHDAVAQNDRAYSIILLRLTC
jgi:hypothetical protein